ncbi:MAG: hypothetical protein JWN99_3261 [Ilumatobacteraceae bacterium]|nr:hypothetical protein [Ilumatobacteraceae bacterium]
MSTDQSTQSGTQAGRGPAFPRAVELVTVSLAAVVVGGIWLGSHAPRRPPLALPTALAIFAALLLAVAIVMVTRVAGFSWDTFVRVGRWALLAYVIAAGMIEFAFVHNHTRGAPLVVVTCMLVLFALDVPFIIATTVARYQD